MQLARKKNITVIPVPGASSVTAALSVPGLPTDRFLFDGFLPSKIVAKTKYFQTEQEIILCAGAIGSPSILLRSGIGKPEELEAVNIKTVLDLPEVGKNLQDHVLVRVGYGAPENVTLHGLTRADRAVQAFLKAYFFGSGPMSVFPLEAGAYISSRRGDIPTIQSHFMPALSSATMRFNPFKKSTPEKVSPISNASPFIL